MCIFLFVFVYLCICICVFVYFHSYLCCQLTLARWVAAAATCNIHLISPPDGSPLTLFTRTANLTLNIFEKYISIFWIQFWEYFYVCFEFNFDNEASNPHSQFSRTVHIKFLLELSVFRSSYLNQRFFCQFWTYSSITNSTFDLLGPGQQVSSSGNIL